MLRRLVTAIDGRPVGWFETFGDIDPEKNIKGTKGDDLLYGGAGDDHINGLAGADTMVGRAGDDTYRVDNAGDVVNEKAGGGVDTVQSSIDWTLGENTENLVLVSDPYKIKNLSGFGNALDNHLVGNYGDNLLDGGDGSDLIEGTSAIGPYGSDTLRGGAGNDTLVGGGLMSSDHLYGEAGDDELHGGQGANFLSGGGGNDHLVAADGGESSLRGDAGNDTLDGGLYLYGGDGDDLMTSAACNGADGGAGNDRIDLFGGDPYGGTLVVDGGAGIDSVTAMTYNAPLKVLGGDGNDTLVARGGLTVTVDGGGGDDHIEASYSMFGPVRIKVDGGDGNDSIVATGHVGAVSVDGGLGNDNLYARAEASTAVDILGGDGIDTLAGGGGLVTLVGGADADEFVLAAKAVLYQDMVYVGDFASGEDHLAVSQAALAVGNGDQIVDGAVTVNGPGGFDASAELVIVAADIFGELTLDAAAAAIGSANQSYAAGQTVVFMVDNGVDSWAVYFHSSGSDAQVSVSELSLLTQLSGASSTTIDDVVWGA